MFDRIMRAWSMGQRSLGSLRALDAWSALQQRIADAVVLTDPYPYFVAESVLPPAALQEIYDHWPQRSEFRPEIAHNYVCELLEHRLADRTQRGFWSNFVRTYGREIAIAGAVQFKPWIAARFSDDVEISTTWIGLMESDPAYAGHRCHTHHYHGPGWVGTLLFYLDANAAGYPGTTIMHHGGATLGDRSEMAANTLQWFKEPAISEAVTVDYRQNRLFGFLDSPISYHSVQAAKPNAVGHRRIFRVHLAAADAAVEKAYGMPLRRYKKQRKTPQSDPAILAGLARDIEKIEACSRQVAERRQPTVVN